MKLLYVLNRLQDKLDAFRALDFLAPLAFRLLLGPIFIVAGLNKFEHWDSVAGWFGDSLGLPFPELMVFLAASAELGGGILLLAGLAVRWVSIPLMVTMLVAIFSVHLKDGWFAIASTNPDSSIARVYAAAGFPGAKESLENSREVAKRLERARSILREHGNYSWLTERGRFVVLNNGVEFAVTYLIMLLSLFFTGAGRFASVDYWLEKRFRDVQTSG